MHIQYTVSTVSFADEDYSVSEGAGTLTVNVTRSGSTETSATVLVATDNFQGTASGEQNALFCAVCMYMCDYCIVVVTEEYIIVVVHACRTDGRNE